jgi:hypothetical protein
VKRLLRGTREGERGREERERNGGSERAREEARERGRKRGNEGARERGREGGREGEREGERERGRGAAVHEGNHRTRACLRTVRRGQRRKISEELERGHPLERAPKAGEELPAATAEETRATGAEVLEESKRQARRLR